jgi:hypothetical protein
MTTLDENARLCCQGQICEASTDGENPFVDVCSRLNISGVMAGVAGGLDCRCRGEQSRLSVISDDGE